MIVQHLLAFVLIVGVPVWDRFETRRLKTSRDPRAKIQSYQMTVGWLSVCTLVACLAVGPGTLFSFGGTDRPVPWLPDRTQSAPFVVGALCSLVIVSLLPAIAARRNPQVATRLSRALDRLSFFLPSTRAERRWFLLVCLAAGIGEEMLYRGFLIRYFQGAPLHWGLVVAAAASCLVFGLGHLYQGVSGVVQTAVAAAVFTVIFIVTGNLLASMVIHVLIDARLLLMLRPAPEPPV